MSDLRTTLAQRVRAENEFRRKHPGMLNVFGMVLPPRLSRDRWEKVAAEVSARDAARDAERNKPQPPEDPWDKLERQLEGQG